MTSQSNDTSPTSLVNIIDMDYVLAHGMTVGQLRATAKWLERDEDPSTARQHERRKANAKAIRKLARKLWEKQNGHR